jgi:hypothetical protein
VYGYIATQQYDSWSNREGKFGGGDEWKRRSIQMQIDDKGFNFLVVVQKVKGKKKKRSAVVFPLLRHHNKSIK